MLIGYLFRWTFKKKTKWDRKQSSMIFWCSVNPEYPEYLYTVRYSFNEPSWIIWELSTYFSRTASFKNWLCHCQSDSCWSEDCHQFSFLSLQLASNLIGNSSLIVSTCRTFVGELFVLFVGNFKLPLPRS